MSDTVSFNAFGRLIGVSGQAVSKAVKRGRLARSVGRDGKGRRVIADVALARVEWAESTSRPPVPPARTVSPTPVEQITVEETDDGLMVLAVVADEDAEVDLERDTFIVMTPETAVAVGRWLHAAATAKLEGRD